MTAIAKRPGLPFDRPRTLSDALLGWLDGVPWWAMVLVGIAGLVGFFILSPAHMVANRVASTAEVSAGSQFAYEIVVTNNGPAQAVRTTLTEVLPAGLSFVKAEPAPKQQTGQEINWDVPDLGNHQSATFKVTVKASAAGRPIDMMSTVSPVLHWRTVSVDILEFLSAGVKVTVLVTLYSFLLAIVLGLLAGLGRVTKPPRGVASVFAVSYILRGLVRVAIGLALYYGLVRSGLGGLRFSSSAAVLIGLLLYLAPVVLHPYTISSVYVEVFRGVPMLVQVLYLGFVVRPFLTGELSRVVGREVNFSEFAAAIIGLGLGYGAYLAEVFRAGIESIHRGQMEAARSLGMNYGQAMRYVILPQAIRRVLPPLANDSVALLKDSSFVSVLSVADLTRQGRLYMSRTYRAFESWNMVAFSYLILTFILSGLARLVEKRMSANE